MPGRVYPNYLKGKKPDGGTAGSLRIVYQKFGKKHV
jgi:hypothetical protein